MSFPQRHPLCGPGADAKVDYRLGLETGPADVALIGPKVDSLHTTRDLHGIGFGGLRGTTPTAEPTPANRIGRRVAIDAEASLAALIAAVQQTLTPARQRVIDERKRRHAAANHSAFVKNLEAALEIKRKGWDASPVSTARI